MVNNTGGPAFPLQSIGPDFDPGHSGMTLRDYFAAHAPEPAKNWRGGERSTVDIVQWRWAYADAMLRAREQK